MNDVLPTPAAVKTMREGFGLEGFGKDGETFGRRA